MDAERMVVAFMLGVCLAVPVWIVLPVLASLRWRALMRAAADVERAAVWIGGALLYPFWRAVESYRNRHPD